MPTGEDRVSVQSQSDQDKPTVVDKLGDAGNDGGPSCDKGKWQNHFRHDTAVHSKEDGPFGVSIEISRSVLFIIPLVQTVPLNP
jgi:hypothetical protein